MHPKYITHFCNSQPLSVLLLPYILLFWVCLSLTHSYTQAPTAYFAMCFSDIQTCLSKDTRHGQEEVGTELLILHFTELPCTDKLSECFVHFLFWKATACTDLLPLNRGLIQSWHRTLWQSSHISQNVNVLFFSTNLRLYLKKKKVFRLNQTPTVLMLSIHMILMNLHNHI